MSKAKVECARCHRVRYEDRLTRKSVNWLGEPTIWYGHMVCMATTTCKSFRKKWHKTLDMSARLG